MLGSVYKTMGVRACELERMHAINSYVSMCCEAVSKWVVSLWICVGAFTENNRSPIPV